MAQVGQFLYAVEHQSRREDEPRPRRSRSGEQIQTLGECARAMFQQDKAVRKGR